MATNNPFGLFYPCSPWREAHASVFLSEKYVEWRKQRSGGADHSEHPGSDINFNPNPITGKRGGEDVDMDVPIYAIKDGVVTDLITTPGWGTVIMIEHQGDSGGVLPKVFWSQYGHVYRVYVRQGQRVSGGTKIATIGKGYNQTQYGAHLHFEIRTAKRAANYWPNKDSVGLKQYGGDEQALIRAAYVDPIKFLTQHGAQDVSEAPRELLHADLVRLRDVNFKTYLRGKGAGYQLRTLRTYVPKLGERYFSGPTGDSYRNPHGVSPALAFDYQLYTGAKGSEKWVPYSHAIYAELGALAKKRGAVWGPESPSKDRLGESAQDLRGHIELVNAQKILADHAEQVAEGRARPENNPTANASGPTTPDAPPKNTGCVTK